MKNMFGVNVTENKENERIDGECFRTREISEIQKKQLERAAVNGLEQEERKEIPGVFWWIGKICGLIALLIAGGMVSAIFDDERTTPVGEMLARVWWLVLIAVVCGAFWGICTLAEKRKAKNVEESEEYQRANRETEQRIEASRAELEIPADAAELDILHGEYRIKNGKAKPEAMSKLTPIVWLNLGMWVYRREECLCIAGLESEYSVPLGEIRGIREIRKSIVLPLWNKEESPYHSKEYKPYRLKEDTAGVRCKPYYVLEIVHGGEEYGVYFPKYELEAMQKMSGAPMISE